MKAYISRFRLLPNFPPFFFPTRQHRRMSRRISFIFVELDSLKVLAYKKKLTTDVGIFLVKAYITRFCLLPTFPPSFPHQTPRTHVAEDFLHLRRA